MSLPVRLALLGFTPFESGQILATLQPHTGVQYVQAEDLASAGLAVVNADHEPSVADVRRLRRLATTVALGSTPCPGAAAQLGRAFNAVALRRTLDRLALATPPVSDAVRRVQQDLARLGGSRLTRPPSPPPERPTAAMPLIQSRPAPRRRAALVVDDGDACLHQLARALQGWPGGNGQDWQPDWQLARSAPQALQQLALLQPQWVFIRTGLDSLDGFHTCRLLRQGLPPGRPPPQLVLLLDADGAVGRLRAQQAGADAVLTLPLDTLAVRALLQPAAPGRLPIMEPCRLTQTAASTRTHDAAAP